MKIIKNLAKYIVYLFVFAEAYLMIVPTDDDRAGGVFMGLLGIAFFGIISIVAGSFEKKLE